MARRPATPDTAMSEVPPDVRLMNALSLALFALLLLGSLALAAAWLVRQPLFSLAGIRIEGDMTRNNVTTIRANALPSLVGNFFTLDLEDAQRAFEAVPWVRRAVVQRVWPNRLVVRLEEHVPVALWTAADGTEKLVNRQGEVFDANLGDVEDDDLPQLSGPDGSSAHALSLLQRLAPVLQPMDERVERLVLSDRGSWQVLLDNGARLELGRGDDDQVLARTAQFVATVGEVVARYERPLEYADLRHHTGYAVRLKGVSTLGPGEKPPRPPKTKR